MSTNKQQEEIPRKHCWIQKYEKSVSESRKLRTSIERVVDRNITVISKKLIRWCPDQIERVTNDSEVSNDDVEIYDVYNVYNHQKCPNKNAVNF